MNKRYQVPIVMAVISALLIGSGFSCCLLFSNPAHFIQSKMGVDQGKAKDCCAQPSHEKSPAPHCKPCACRINLVVSLEPETGILKSSEVFSFGLHKEYLLKTTSAHSFAYVFHPRVYDLVSNNSHITIPLYLQFQVLRI